MSKQIERISTGDCLEPDFVYLDLLMQGLDVGSKEFALDAFNYMAKRNAYNPVAEYLERVHKEHRNSGEELLNTAATRYLGHTDWLYLSFVRKTLISAVARALDPGCKVDTTLIFTGKQGAGKSSFWDKLAGDWFCDSLAASTSDPDEKLKLHSAWIHEWGELESVFKRKETSQVKAFLTSRSDTFREPWGRTTQKHPRVSIIVGTTNTDDFLTDPTGDRRYWVIPIKQTICLELLERDKDKLWAAAVHAYKQGAKWELSDPEKAESARRNKQFQSEDPWFSQVSLYLDVHDQVREQQGHE
jgi:predicted P-loop ATPase